MIRPITITIGTTRRFGDRRIMARVFGDWAVHRPYGTPSGWVITHVPSGLCLPEYSLTNKQSIKLARRLGARVPTLAIRCKVGETATVVDPKATAIACAVIREFLGEAQS